MSSKTNNASLVSWIGGVFALILVVSVGYLVWSTHGVAITQYVDGLGTIGSTAAFLTEKVGVGSAFAFVYDVLAGRWLDLIISLFVIRATFELIREYTYAYKVNRTFKKNGSTSRMQTDLNRVTEYLKVAALLSVVYFVFHAYAAC